MVSKELLSEVLKYKVYKVSLLNKDKVHINVTGDTEKYTPNTMQYNIYELAHKCKEWALKQGYFIYSTNELAYIKTLNLEILPNVFSNGEDDETICIFKACEWILNEIKK